MHLEYGEFKAVVSLPYGKLLEGNFPNDKVKLVLAWMVIHNDELLASWTLAVVGEKIFKIDSLKSVVYEDISCNQTTERV